MTALLAYGPIVLGAAMMLLMVFTSLRIWRAHKRAMAALDQYNEAIGKAIAAVEADPRGFLQAMADMDQHRRMH